MDYKELKKMTKGKQFPLAGRTAKNEPVIIEQGETDNGHFFKLTIAQDNNWCRIVTFWANGDAEETFKK